MATVSGGDISYSVGVDLSGLKQGLTNAQQSIKQHSTAIGASMTAAGAAITGVFGKASSDAMSFGGAMAEVATLGVKDMDGLEASLKDISTTYGMDLVGSVNAAYQAISAGASEMEAPLLLENAAKAATAGVSDLTTAISLGTSVTNAFGGELSNVNVIYDQAFTAVKHGVTTFDELASSVGTLSPAFASANLGSDQMFASITALTKGGVSTSEAVTQLRGVINSVVAPTEGAKKAAEELGIQWNLAALESQGLNGFLQTLKDATGGNVEQMKQFIGSAEAFTGVLSLTGAQAETFSQVLAEMGNSTGATQEAFNKLAASDPGLAWRQLKSEMQVLSVEIGQALMPALKALMDAITPMVQGIKNFAQEHSTLTAALVTVTAAVGALMLALGPLVIALPTLAPAVTAAGAAFTATAGIVSGPMVAALVALGAAWYGIEAYIDGVEHQYDEFETNEELRLQAAIARNQEAKAQSIFVQQEAFVASVALREQEVAETLRIVNEQNIQLSDGARQAAELVVGAWADANDRTVEDDRRTYQERLRLINEYSGNLYAGIEYSENRISDYKGASQLAQMRQQIAHNNSLIENESLTQKQIRELAWQNTDLRIQIVKTEMDMHMKTLYDGGKEIYRIRENQERDVTEAYIRNAEARLNVDKKMNAQQRQMAQQTSTQIGQIAHNTTNNVVNAGYTMVNSAIIQMQQAYNYGMQLSMQIVAERNRIWNQWQQQYNSSIERWRANDPSGSYMVPLDRAAEFLNQFRGPGSMPLTDADFMPLKQAGEKLDAAADKITAAVDPIPDTVLNVKAATEGLKSSADKVEQEVVPDAIAAADKQTAAAEKQTAAAQSMDDTTAKLQTTAETLDMVPPKIDQAADNIQVSGESISMAAPKLDTAAENISNSASEIRQSVTPSLSGAAQEISKAASQVQPASFKLETAAGALQQASSAQTQAAAPLNTAAQNISIASGSLIAASDKIGNTLRSRGSTGGVGGNSGGPNFGGYLDGVDISSLGPGWSIPGNQRIAGPGITAPNTSGGNHNVTVNVAANTDASPADIAQAVGTAVQGALRGAGAQSQRGGW